MTQYVETASYIADDYVVTDYVGTEDYVASGYVSGITFGEASLTVTATVSASALNVTFGVAGLTSSATLTATATRIQTGATIVASLGTLTAIPNRIVRGSTPPGLGIQSAFFLEGPGARIRTDGASLLGSFTLTSEAVTIIAGDASLTSSATLT